jgi:polyferredoxin
MDKLGRDRGLIAYATLADYQANMRLATGEDGKIDPSRVRTAEGRLSERFAHFDVRKLLRPRTFVYAGAWSLAGLAIVYGLLARDRLEVNVLHDRNPQFVVLSDGSIRNGYTVKLLNKIPEPRTIVVTLQGLRGAEMSVVGMNQPPDRAFAVEVEPDRLKTMRVFVRQPREEIGSTSQEFRFVVEDKSSFETDTYVATFAAPETSR